MKLRPYQIQDLQNVLSNLKEGKRVMYQSPTGSGKSLIASEVVHQYSNKRVLIVAHRREILFQLQSRLSTDKITPGLLIGEIQQNLDSNILIGSVLTLSRSKRLSTILSKPFDLVLIDEAHHLRTSSYDTLLDHLILKNKSIKILGLTATPFRSDKKDFREYIDVLVKGKDISELISDGYLANYKTFVTSLGDIDSEVEKNENDFNLTQLSKYMRKEVYLNHLVSQYRKHGQNKQCLIFAVDTKHLNSIIQKFKEEGFDSIDSITSNTSSKERERVLCSYEDKKLQFLVSIGTLTEGTDLPDTGCLLIARPTQSLILFHQILGRGMRLSSDSSDLIILDCGGFTQTHGLVSGKRNWSLNPLDNPKEKSERDTLVGKRKDGTYTDDISEIESGDLEVEEMSPEEFLSHAENSVEKAEERNQELEEQKKSEISRLIDELLKLFKILGLTIDLIKLEEDFNLENLKVNLPKLGANFNLKFKYKNGLLIPDITKPYIYESHKKKEDYEKELEVNQILGDVSRVVIKGKGEFSEIFEAVKRKIETLDSKKVNVKELKEKKDAFLLEQFELKLKSLLVNSKVIYFKDPMNLYHYYRDMSGSCYAIEFSQNRLLSTNRIKFYVEKKYDWYEERRAKEKGTKLKPCLKFEGELKALEKAKLLDQISNKEISDKPFYPEFVVVEDIGNS